jgi:hypothetical protein
VTDRRRNGSPNSSASASVACRASIYCAGKAAVESVAVPHREKLQGDGILSDVQVSTAASASSTRR